MFDVLMESKGMGRTPGFTEIEINGEGRETSGAILKARATGLPHGILSASVCHE